MMIPETARDILQRLDELQAVDHILPPHVREERVGQLVDQLVVICKQDPEAFADQCRSLPFGDDLDRALAMSRALMQERR